MRIHLLRYVVYEGESGPSEHEVLSPSVSDIEESIHRLDRDKYPFVWLYSNKGAEENSVPDLEVVGGKGAFAVHCETTMGRCKLVRPDLGGAEIDLWESDQGAACQRWETTDDIEEVLAAVAYYAQHGDSRPGLEWQDIKAREP